MRHDYRNDPVLVGALAYWRAKRGDRAMPSRRDIDPVELRSLLPHLQLIEIVADRFRYRLIGTALVEAMGRDYTGRYPDDLFEGPRAKMITDVYEAVRARQEPMFLRSRYMTTKDIDLVANRLYLPLAEDGRAVNMILGALTFHFGSLEPEPGLWGSARLAGDAELEPVSVGDD